MNGRGEGGRPPLRALLGRLRAYVWRFGTLPYSRRLFDGVASPLVLRRPFCGFDLYLDVSRSSLQRLLYLEGERYVGERRLLASLLRPGMHVADVGANLGYYALLAARAVGPEGWISCFEPEPENLRELRRNVSANGLANVEVIAAAAGAEDGEVRFHPGINGAIVSGGGGEGDLTVPLRRLDSVLDGQVDFLKIDVEGYEGPVLAGAERILREQRPALFVEVHPGRLAPPWTVDSLLATLSALYPRIDFYTPAGGNGLARARARYLGPQVERVEDPEALLAACREGQRQEPFWAVCASPPMDA